MTEKKKILVAEDEDAIRMALSQELTAAGFEVLEAPDGQVALDKSLAEHPDLIILDIIMPRLHGVDVYKAIREEEKWGQDVKIILLTNVATDVNVQKAAENPRSRLIVKNDIKLNEFIPVVKEYINE